VLLLLLLLLVTKNKIKRTIFEKKKHQFAVLPTISSMSTTPKLTVDEPMHVPLDSVDVPPVSAKSNEPPAKRSKKSKQSTASSTATAAAAAAVQSPVESKTDAPTDDPISIEPASVTITAATAAPVVQANGKHVDNLRVYLCLDHNTIFPEPAGAIVRAVDESEARNLLDVELERAGLKAYKDYAYTFRDLTDQFKQPTARAILFVADSTK
jgi:hypothetical protein